MDSGPNSKLRQAALIAVLSFNLASGSASAQDLAAGKSIAKTWCSNCHVIDAGGRRNSDAVPSFDLIANMSTTTATSLTVFLSTPHGRMPDYALSRVEIRDVSAYILSLRKVQ